MKATDIRVALIDANPNQPRKRFPADHIQGLANSIKERGLIQPITLRPRGRRFVIVTGECRWRAHQLLERKTIAAFVEKMTDEEMELKAIVENLQRRDMNPMEEARAFESLLKRGYTQEKIMRELGIGERKYRSRADLLNLTPEIQQLVATDNLDGTKAWAISVAPKSEQRRLMHDVLSGKIKTTEELRAIGRALNAARAQVDAFAHAPRVTKRDLAALTKLEKKVEIVVDMVATGFKDGECVAAQRVSPDRVKTLVEKMTLIRKHLLYMEQSLRTASAQSTFLQGM